MSRQVYVLSHPQARRNAARACVEAPEGYRVTITPPKRSTAANAKMWAMLADIVAQVPWRVNGREEFLDAEEWKNVLSASLQQERRIAEGYRGGVVLLGLRTSRMTASQMGDMIELMTVFGAEHGVAWTGSTQGDE